MPLETETITEICHRVGLDQVTIVADQTEVQRQEAGAAVSFADALEAALRTLIAPGDGNPEHDGAPWDYVAAVPEAFGLPGNADADAIAAIVREIVNQTQTVIYLLEPNDYDPELSERDVFPPEYGETIDENWVFYTPLDEFGSLHWMIVDKSGKKPAYCYGHD